MPFVVLRAEELGRPLFAVRLVVRGEDGAALDPAPWARGTGRALAGPHGPVSVGGGFAKNYRRWRTAAVAQLRQAWTLPPIVRPVYVGLSFVFTRPSVRPRAYTVRGHRLAYPYPWTDGRNPYVGTADADNLVKAALDTLQAEGQRKRDRAGAPVLLDDRLAEPVPGPGGRWRWYAADGEEPCVEVRIWSAV